MDRYKLKLEKTEKRRIRQIPVKSKSGREISDRERKWAGKTGYAGGVGMGAVVGSHLSGRAKNLFVGKNAVRALRLRKALGRGTGAVGGAALGSAIGIGAGVKLGGVAGRLSDKMKKKKVKESSIATFLDRKDQIRLFEALVLRRQALANLLEAKDNKIVSRRAKKGALAGALIGGGYGAGQWGIAKHVVRPHIKDLVAASDPKLDTKVASGVTSLLSKGIGGYHIGSKATKGALVGAGLGAGVGLVGRLKRRKKK